MVQPNLPFQVAAKALSSKQKEDNTFEARVRHLMQTNLNDAFRAVGSESRSTYRGIRRHIYGVTGLIANFMSLGLDPSDPKNYQGLIIGTHKISPDDIQKLHSKLDDVTFGPFELPERSVARVNAMQKRNYKLYIQKHAKGLTSLKL